MPFTPCYCCINTAWCPDWDFTSTLALCDSCSQFKQLTTVLSTTACTLLVTAIAYHNPGTPKPHFNAIKPASGSPKPQKMPKFTSIPTHCRPAPLIAPDKTVLILSPNSDMSKPGRHATTRSMTTGSVLKTAAKNFGCSHMGSVQLLPVAIPSTTPVIRALRAAPPRPAPAQKHARHQCKNADNPMMPATCMKAQYWHSATSSCRDREGHKFINDVNCRYSNANNSMVHVTASKY